MTLQEFNDLTGLNIMVGEDYAKAYELVEQAYMRTTEDKQTFCRNLMADFSIYKTMPRCKHLDETYCLWEFMKKVGYTSYIDRPTYKYEIYQTNNRDYSFMSYEFAESVGFDFNDYNKVYEGKDEYPKGIDERYIEAFLLDKIYEKFNLKHPRGYKGRSLSVSDIVILNNKKYYCDSIGWKEIK